MKQKYLVKVPLEPLNPDSGYKEFRFCTRSEVMEFLNITNNTLSTMLNYKLQCVLDKHAHLRGIQVERLSNPREDLPVDPVEYQKRLLEKS
jgi:hypothetical protein